MGVTSLEANWVHIECVNSFSYAVRGSLRSSCEAQKPAAPRLATIYQEFLHTNGIQGTISGYTVSRTSVHFAEENKEDFYVSVCSREENKNVGDNAHLSVSLNEGNGLLGDVRIGIFFSSG